MKAQPYKQSSTGTDHRAVSNSYITEALEKQAATRPARKPPREMPVTPTLPRMPKPHKRRGR